MDKPGLVELSRVYNRPIVFDFTGPIDAASGVSPVDEKVRIGKNILQLKLTPPFNYSNDLESIDGKKECFVPHINSPEFEKCLAELWKRGPQYSEIPCTFDGPSSSF